MAFVSAPTAPFTYPAGKAVASNTNLVLPVANTATNPPFRAAWVIATAGSNAKPYGYAIT